MNPRERYIAVLEHREPDMFPVHFGMHPDVIPKVLDDAENSRMLL